MQIALSAAGAVLPSVLLLWFFYRHDRRPEPHHVLLVTFLLGVLSVVPLLGLGLVLAMYRTPLDDALLEGLVLAFLYAAIPEELLKFLVVMVYCARQPSFDERMDGIIYCITASLGFATLENVLYVTGREWTMALTRGLTAVPMHAFLGVVLGYYVGLARLVQRPAKLLGRGLLVVILAHGIYNFPLLTIGELARQPAAREEPPAGLIFGLLVITFTMLAVTGIWSVRVVRRMARVQEERI